MSSYFTTHHVLASKQHAYCWCGIIVKWLRRRVPVADYTTVSIIRARTPSQLVDFSYALYAYYAPRVVRELVDNASQYTCVCHTRSYCSLHNSYERSRARNMRTMHTARVCILLASTLRSSQYYAIIFFNIIIREVVYSTSQYLLFLFSTSSYSII